MEFEGFEWDAGNSAKCQKHGLSLDEIESVFSRRVLIMNDEANSEAEQRFRAIGVTGRGDGVRSLLSRYAENDFARSAPATCTERRSRAMKKTIPTLETDEEAERFVDTADLSEYDLSGQFVKFELRRKDKTVSLRLPEALLNEVRLHAKRAGMPYQRFIRMAVERAVHEPK